MLNRLLPMIFLLIPGSSLAQPNPTQESIENLFKHRSLLADMFQENNLPDTEVKRIAIAEDLGVVERKLAHLLDLGKTQHEGEDYRSMIGSLSQTFSWLADAYEARERFPDAIAAQKEVIRAEIELHGNDHFRTIDAGLRLKEIEFIAKMLPNERQELEQTLNWNKLAVAMYRAEQFKKALPLAQSVMGTYKRLLGEQHTLFVTSLNNLADLYEKTGDYGLAEQMLERSAEVTKTAMGDRHPSYAKRLDLLARFYVERRGDYLQAESIMVVALRVQKHVYGEQHPKYASALGHLAKVYHSLGNYERAESLYSVALLVLRQSGSQHHPDYSTNLDSLAALFQAMGDFTRDKPLLTEAINIQKQTLGELHPHYARSLMNLAIHYHRNGESASAESLLAQVLDIQEQVFGRESAEFAFSLNALGGIIAEMEDWTRAEPLLEQAAQIRKRVLGSQHPHYTSSLNNLAECYSMKGDYALAVPLYRQALEIAKVALGDQHPNYAICLNNLALLYHEMGDYTRAEALFVEAIDLTLNHLEKTAASQSEQQQILMSQSLRYRLDNYLGSCIEGKLNPHDAIARLVAWKGSILRRSRSLRLAAADPAIADQFRQLQSVASQISAATRTTPKTEQLAAWKQRFGDLNEQQRKLEAELMRSSTVFRAAVEQVSFDSIRQSIPEDGVLVDYLEYRGKNGPALAASLIRRNGDLVLLDLGSAENAGKAIDTWRTSFGMSTDAKAAGAALRLQLWEPLLVHIQGAKLVLVSTDGVLGRLPIVALPGASPDSYLIEDHRIALIPVPSMLPSIVKQATADNELQVALLMGDVNYDAADDSAGEIDSQAPTTGELLLANSTRGDVVTHSGIHWQRLGETGREIDFIGDLIKRTHAGNAQAVTALRNRSATRSAFVAAVPHCQWLHLATHGFFAPPEIKNALSSSVIAESRGGFKRSGMFGEQREHVVGVNPGQLSGLVFAGANQRSGPIDPLEGNAKSDNGILTADEIAFLPMNTVQLAVLSACETGLGESAGGEGLLGLQRALQVAGVKTSVATLWKINDPATRKIMEVFYSNVLDKKLGMLDAMRETQLWALNHPQDVPRRSQGDRGVVRDKNASSDESSSRLSPEYWAPFVLSGDWR